MFLENPLNNPDRTSLISDTFVSTLTAAEREAMEDYCGSNGYSRISGALYGSEDMTEVAEQIKRIDNALAKTPTAAQKHILYRATKLYDHSFADPGEAQAELASRFRIGETVTIPGYMSTTANPGALFDFMREGYADMQEIAAKRKGSLFAPKPFSREAYAEMFGEDPALTNIVYEIETRGGAPVSSIGHVHAEKEQEYLLPRNQQFRVIDVQHQVRLVNPDPRGSAHSPTRHATIVRLQSLTA